MGKQKKSMFDDHNTTVILGLHSLQSDSNWLKALVCTCEENTWHSLQQISLWGLAEHALDSPFDVCRSVSRDLTLKYPLHIYMSTKSYLCSTCCTSTAWLHIRVFCKSCLPRSWNGCQRELCSHLFSGYTTPWIIRMALFMGPFILKNSQNTEMHPYLGNASISEAETKKSSRKKWGKLFFWLNWTSSQEKNNFDL